MKSYDVMKYLMETFADVGKIDMVKEEHADHKKEEYSNLLFSNFMVVLFSAGIPFSVFPNGSDPFVLYGIRIDDIININIMVHKEYVQFSWNTVILKDQKLIDALAYQIAYTGFCFMSDNTVLLQYDGSGYRLYMSKNIDFYAEDEIDISVSNVARALCDFRLDVQTMTDRINNTKKEISANNT